MKLIFKLSIIGFLMACNSQPNKESTEEETVRESEIQAINESSLIIEKEGLKLISIANGNQFNKASINLIAPTNAKEGLNVFEYELENYDLGEHTTGTHAEMLANSNGGQHIHYIHNNSPYKAKYERKFEVELFEGNNVVLSFLSKSFHESIKSQSAFYFHNFYIGSGQSSFDESAPHLFYSRPKGNYSIEEGKHLLFDFYLVNTSLSEEGNKVKLTVDGIDFIITVWQAYFIEGLRSGKHNFRIQLLNEKGELIEGPFNNSGLREIIIE